MKQKIVLEGWRSVVRLWPAGLLLVLTSVWTMPARAGTADAPEAPDRAALEAELEEARAELDAAAARLGELHRQLYAAETVGHHGRKPMLGVLLGGRGPNRGLMLVGVTPGGGAEAAGLRAGDELTEVNQVDLTIADKAMPALKEALASVTTGDTVPVAYQRNGSLMVADVATQSRGVYFMGMTGFPNVEVDVERLETMANEMASEKLESMDFTASTEWVESLDTLENLESLEGMKSRGEMPAVFHRAISIAGPLGGLRLEDVSADLGRYFGVESGVLILAAPAAQGGRPGLRAGDILLTVDGEMVANAGEGYRALLGARRDRDAAASVSVEVLRDGLRETVTVAPEAFGPRSGNVTIHRGGAVRGIRADPS